MVKTTFGCGTLLPGYGPLSFGGGLPVPQNIPGPDPPAGGGPTTGEDLTAAFEAQLGPPGTGGGPGPGPPLPPINPGKSVYFINYSTGDATHFKWTFEGGATNNNGDPIDLVIELEEPNPVVYNHIGSWYVKLEISKVVDGVTISDTITKDDLIVVEAAVIPGCTDKTALNYNPKATEDDGSCKYPPPIVGCMDPTANNYNPRATQACPDCCTYDPVVRPPDYEIGPGATTPGQFDGAKFGSEYNSSVIIAGTSNFVPQSKGGTGGYKTPMSIPPGESEEVINLNTFPTKTHLLRNHSTGVLDSVNVFKIRSPITANTTGIKQRNRLYDTTSTIFKDVIHNSINRILLKGNSFDTWSVGWTQDLTQPNIFESLNPTFLKTLSKIKYSDGNFISDEDMYFLVKNRLIRDASVDEINPAYFNYLARSSKNSLPRVIPSKNRILNEMYALKILEEASIALDYKKHNNIKHELLKNYYVLPTDIDAKVPIRLSDGTQSSLSVKDDNTFSCSTLPIVNPGYFIRLNTSNGRTRLPLTTQIDRAYMYGSNYGAAAKKLLGGSGKKSIETSSPFNRGEFTKTLNLSGTEAYDSVYFLSAVLSSVSSTYTSKSSMLKETSALYEVLDTSSPQGIEDFNGLIRNIVNFDYFYINHNDDMWPHILTEGKVTFTQEDISYFGPIDGNDSIYPRAFSPIIAIMPEGKLECNPLGVRSTIQDIIKDDKIVRKLNFIPSLDSKFYTDGGSPFLNTLTLATTVPSTSATDVYGNNDFDARITTYNPTNPAFTNNYRASGVVTSVEPRRSTGSFTLLKNIIEELDDNYELTEDVAGKLIYESDLFYRLAWKEYSDIAYLNNWSLIYKLVADGLFRDIRVIPPVRNTSQMSINHTGLIRRKAGASTDRYDPIKTDNNGLFLLPPNTLGVFPTPTGVNPATPGTRRNSRDT